jgi:predicted RNase H-like nuclease (RuvC/YqgF family)
MSDNTSVSGMETVISKQRKKINRLKSQLLESVDDKVVSTIQTQTEITQLKNNISLLNQQMMVKK